MQRKRMLPPILIAVFAMSAATVVALSPTAVGAPAGLHGQPIGFTFRGTTAPLKQIASAKPTRPLGAGEDVAAELEILRMHDEQRSEEEGGETVVTGWDIPTGPNAQISGADDSLSASWQGLNHFDSRYSDGGNQFSGEPPDQGLCVGGGYVLETVNSVMQIYKQNGAPLLRGQAGAPGAGKVGLSLGQVLDYPPTFVRPAGPFGPFLFDVSCYYDKASHRWFHLIDNLEQDPTTGAFTGNGGLDLAVSAGPNPLGRWNLYFLATQNDGTQGTPDHGCDLGPCFADYPHIGADANGIYLTTNEYAFFGDSYNGVQLYALSKADLADGAEDVSAMYFPNLTVPELYQDAFTLRGAQSRPSSFEAANGGVEYFLSSTAGDGYETGNDTGGSDQLVVWALSGTSTLDASAPDPALQHTLVTSIPYVLPPKGLQKDGPTPLLKCINLGKKCVGDPRPFKQEGPYPLDSGDTRVMSSFFQHGVLWGALDTGLKGKGGSNYDEDNFFAPEPIHQKAGIAYFAIRPDWTTGLDASIETQGYVGAKNANLTYPSLAVGKGDHAVMGASLVGPGYYPSAVYLPLSLSDDPGTAFIAGAGHGPDDGFTGTFEGGFRPRWGDYGYAVPGANGSVWFSAEYIAQRCSFETFFADSTCGNTRSFFANWSTRVSRIQT